MGLEAGPPHSNLQSSLILEGDGPEKSKRKLTKCYPWNHYLLLYTCPSSYVVCIRFWYYWQLRCSGWKPWCLFFFFLILSCLSVHLPTYIYLMNSQKSLKKWTVLATLQMSHLCFLISNQDTMPGVPLHSLILPCSYFQTTELITSPSCSEFCNGSSLPVKWNPNTFPWQWRIFITLFLSAYNSKNKQRLNALHCAESFIYMIFYFIPTLWLKYH